MDFNFNESLTNLKQKINSNSITSEDVKQTLENYKTLGFEILKLLEYAIKTISGDEKEKITKIYERFLSVHAGEMTERLRGLGYSLRKNSNYNSIVSALSDQAFRIMERTRHSQRSEVFYMIGRIFITHKKEFPPLLAQAFNPDYSDELFKTFIYSFLSGVLAETEQGGAE